ncbi:MAG TPA: hypothetical protein VK594_02625 [Streptosporangiaceae bacterium]|nr:hypothetical protein [Streptosporangiaceae bacterium]
MAWVGALAVRTIVVRVGLLATGEHAWWPDRSWVSSSRLRSCRF